jgi:hypothetical protein
LGSRLGALDTLRETRQDGATGTFSLKNQPPPKAMIDFVPTLAAVALPAYVGPVVALVAGILILLKPDLLAKIVAIYLIVVGALGLLG